MSGTYYFPPYIGQGAKAMIFVDGENLAIRYGKLLQGKQPPTHVVFEPDVFVWTDFANVMHHTTCEVLRRYYYTSVQGDAVKIDEVEEKLKALGIEAPRVFKKEKGKRAKRVDISLTTDMLMHAHRKNYNVAVLVAGDEDYIPLVDEVMAEGHRVVLWFFQEGLSPILKRRVDHFFDISMFLLRDEQYLSRRY